MVKNKKAFTLVELLAVIVILAVILVIALPQIMDTIKESRKGALASSAKLIASTAETKKVSNDTLGIEEEITCSNVTKLNSEDYESCTVTFDENGKAQVTIVGKGKFEGMSVCSGTKENAEVTEGECTGTGGSVETVSFEEDDWATIKAAVAAGSTENYNVGDTKTVDLGDLGIHTVRIANKTACDGTLASETACGFVVEFADIITTHAMNTTLTNVGGWPGSQMYDYINVTEETGSGVIYNALVATIGNVIIDTKVVSGHGNGDTAGTLANNNFYSEDKLYLLSTREVWGTSPDYDTAGGDTITRQLDYYKNNNVTTSNYSGAIKQNAGSNAVWWLRSAYSNDTDMFYFVNYYGGWYYHDCSAGTTDGVSPAFRLG